MCKHECCEAVETHRQRYEGAWEGSTWGPSTCMSEAASELGTGGQGLSRQERDGHCGSQNRTGSADKKQSKQRREKSSEGTRSQLLFLQNVWRMGGGRWERHTGQQVPKRMKKKAEKRKAVQNLRYEWASRIGAKPLCSLQHCLQEPRHGSNLSVYGQMNG